MHIEGPLVSKKTRRKARKFSDDNAGGVHHRIACDWVAEVGDKVVLNIGAEEAIARWRTEGRSRALFEREDSGRRGPHVLNRSFSGTYPDE